MKEDLAIFQKAYDLALYLYPALKHMPKSERYLLVAEIKAAMNQIIGLILEANRTYNKKPVFDELDLQLDMMRIKIRMAKDLKFLPFKKYEIISGYLSEIGKMLGGWIKSVKG